MHGLFRLFASSRTWRNDEERRLQLHIYIYIAESSFYVQNRTGGCFFYIHNIYCNIVLYNMYTLRTPSADYHRRDASAACALVSRRRRRRQFSFSTPTTTNILTLREHITTTNCKRITIMSCRFCSHNTMYDAPATARQ